MKYNVDYFLEMFDAIPEDQWTAGTCQNELGQKCALGHCGQNATGSPMTTKGKRLAKLLKPLHTTVRESIEYVYDVNDGNPDYSQKVYFAELGDHPKERMMNALILIKAGVKL